MGQIANPMYLMRCQLKHLVDSVEPSPYGALLKGEASESTRCSPRGVKRGDSRPMNGSIDRAQPRQI